MSNIFSNFNWDHITLFAADYVPTEQCYMGIAIDHAYGLEKRDEVNVVVMEQKSDGTTFVIASDRTFIQGNILEKDKQYNDFINKYSKKYNAKILKEC